MSKSSPFRFIRFVLDEESPNSPKCTEINQIDLFGETIASEYTECPIPRDCSDDESISIIGRASKEE